MRDDVEAPVIFAAPADLEAAGEVKLNGGLGFELMMPAARFRVIGDFMPPGPIGHIVRAVHVLEAETVGVIVPRKESFRGLRKGCFCPVPGVVWRERRRLKRNRRGP